MIKYPQNKIQNSSARSLVSVLIPCYNAAAHIAETIDSVIAQTHTNWECIVVDDHSTDHSTEIVQSYCDKHPGKIKLFNNPRKGACAARNVAFEHCSGKYIQYLDADDLLAPDKIEKQMRLFKQYGNSIITSGLWGRFYQSIEDVKWEQQIINKDYPSPIDWLVDSWNGSGMMAQHAWLIPRKCIEKGGSWNETLKINQDGEFFSRVILQASSIVFCENAKVYYRSGNTESISQSNKGEAKAASLLHSYRLYQENVKQHYNNINIRKALGHNYLNFMYQYHGYFPALSAKAASYFTALDVGKMWPVGGKRFRQLAAIIGFKNALNLIRFITNMKS